MDAKGLSEKEHYKSFVDRTLAHVIAGLQTDGAAKKRKIANGLDASKAAAPHARVRDARFALGADDASYLQSGLAMLWTTAAGGDGGENELALAPAGLYAPDAVGGVRAGLVRGLRQLNQDMHDSAPKRLQTLAPAILGLLDTPYVYTGSKGKKLADAVDVPGLQEALKKVDNIKDIKDNEDVLRKGLAKLLKLVDGTSGKTLTNAVVNGIKSQVNKARKDALAKTEADCDKRLAALRDELADLEAADDASSKDNARQRELFQQAEKKLERRRIALKKKDEAIQQLRKYVQSSQQKLLQKI